MISLALGLHGAVSLALVTSHARRPRLAILIHSSESYPLAATQLYQSTSFFDDVAAPDPPDPARAGYVRVKVRRRLRGIGAIPLKSTVYVLPLNDAAREAFEWLARERGAEAVQLRQMPRQVRA